MAAHYWQQRPPSGPAAAEPSTTTKMAKVATGFGRMPTTTVTDPQASMSTTSRLWHHPNSPLRNPNPIHNDEADSYASEDDLSQPSSGAATMMYASDDNYYQQGFSDYDTDMTQRPSPRTRRGGGSEHHHQMHPQQRTCTYLPKVLGFSADDQGTKDWLEMLAEMLVRECATLPEVGSDGFCEEYAKRRATLVEWMTQTSESVLELQPLTVHMAVAYLDRVVAKLKGQYIKPSRLQLMATACMLAAAKMEENDGHVPSVYELNRCCQDGYTPQLIVKMESLLLNLLEWNLVVLTPRHFLDMYDGGGALIVQPYEEFVDNSAIPSQKLQTVQRYQRRFAEFFVDLCLQENNFVHYRPSVVAAAALASARRQLKITPIWPHRLARLTQYDLEQIRHCADHIWGVYESNFANGN